MCLFIATLSKHLLGFVESLVSFMITDYKISVEQTPLPGHISRMLDILIDEEAEQNGGEGAIGSCMEYLLQHRILETLYTLARTDVRFLLASCCSLMNIITLNTSFLFPAVVYLMFDKNHRCRNETALTRK
jgi:hypothetical protein